MVEAAVTLPHRAALLKGLKAHQSSWLKLRREYGDAMSAAIIRLALIGWLEQKPYDLSSMAFEMEVPRQSVTRRAEKLQGKGLVELQRDGNRVVVWPTEALLNATAADTK